MRLDLRDMVFPARTAAEGPRSFIQISSDCYSTSCEIMAENPIKETQAAIVKESETFPGKWVSKQDPQIKRLNPHRTTTSVSCSFGVLA